MSSFVSSVNLSIMATFSERSTSLTSPVTYHHQRRAVIPCGRAYARFGFFPHGCFVPV